jgi:hypothetical protein
MGDLGFPGIAVLGDQVAREAREVVIDDLPLAPRPQADHFASAGKMVIAVVPRLLASGHGFLDGPVEVPPLVVAEQWLDLAGAPVFGPVLVHPLRVLERLPAKGGSLIIAHGGLPHPDDPPDLARTPRRGAGPLPTTLIGTMPHTTACNPSRMNPKSPALRCGLLSSSTNRMPQGCNLWGRGPGGVRRFFVANSFGCRGNFFSCCEESSRGVRRLLGGIGGLS